MKLCVAGGGKMAEALIGGLLRTQWATAPEIGVIEIVDERGLVWGTALSDANGEYRLRIQPNR